MSHIFCWNTASIASSINDPCHGETYQITLAVFEVDCWLLSEGTGKVSVPRKR